MKIYWFLVGSKGISSRHNYYEMYSLCNMFPYSLLRTTEKKGEGDEPS